MVIRGTWPGAGRDGGGVEAGAGDQKLSENFDEDRAEDEDRDVLV